jgi:hypothetical protein
MLADVRAAAIDRALVGDDPESALALAGAVDGGIRTTTKDGTQSDDREEARSATPLTAAMIAIGSLAADDDARLDDRAWRPGPRADPLVVAGAAVAVRRRDVGIDRAAALADCAPATLEVVVDRQRRREKER